MQEPVCAWATTTLLRQYHDEEWGVPVHEDNKHFELLCLEGAQAGLSWETVLKKRDAYRQVFYGFDPHLVSRMPDSELEACLQNEGLIRNRRKIWSVRKNAKAFLELQKMFGTFDAFVWRYVNGKTQFNTFKTPEEVPAQTQLSQTISKALKKHGMSFVGPTIIYAYLQSAGLVHDHLVTCPCYQGS